MTFLWTDSAIETLRKLHSEGLSASGIAQRMGVSSRNAVIGKLHRLGLTRFNSDWKKPATVSTDPRPKRRRSVSIATPREAVVNPPFVHAPEPTPEPDLPEEPTVPGGPIRFLEQSFWRCKFPLGEHMDKAEWFCGEPALKPPYCKAHAQLCYQPPPPRKRDDARNAYRAKA